MKKYLLMMFVVVIVLLSVGCSSTPDIKIDERPLPPPKAEPLALREVTFGVQEGTGLITLTAGEYEDLSKNTQDIYQYLEQVITRLEYYEEIYEKGKEEE